MIYMNNNKKTLIATIYLLEIKQKICNLESNQRNSNTITRQTHDPQ
jgi:hypothetical protein